MTCKKCQRTAADGCIICPYCLEPLDCPPTEAVKTGKSRKGWLIAALVLVLLASAAALLYFLLGL